MLYSAPATLLLIVLNVLVGAYTMFVDPSVLERWAFRPALARREWGRWITAGFVHVGLAHLAFNMVTLFFFGPFVEGMLGSWRYLVLYFGSEITANALTYWRHRNSPGYSAAGASGAVTGVLFAFVLFRPWDAIYVLFIPVGIPAVVFSALYVALSIYASKQGGGRVAHEAHLGGAAGGIALTLLLYPAALGIFLRQLGL